MKTAVGALDISELSSNVTDAPFSSLDTEWSIINERLKLLVNHESVVWRQ